MKKIREADLRVARRIALEAGSDILHALQCSQCGLRDQFLFVLGVMGWDEPAFLGAYFDHLMARF
jgi:hypothetical protein